MYCGAIGILRIQSPHIGVSNAPATYQRFMSESLGPLKRLERVFQHFRECNLKLSAKKCHFLIESVRYVGHIISKEDISADPDKVEKVVAWPEPTNVSELRTYLGFAGYYSRFIKNKF